MQRIAIAAVILLAGCTYTPDEIRNLGVRHNVTSKQRPPEAALCIVQNAERIGGGFMASNRPLGKDGREVIIRARGDPIAVAEIVPNDIGSDMYLVIPEGDYLSTFVPKFLGGC